MRTRNKSEIKRVAGEKRRRVTYGPDRKLGPKGIGGSLGREGSSGAVRARKEFPTCCCDTRR